MTIVHYRELASTSDYEQCLELQRTTWGDDFRELVPETVMRISRKIGGIAAGAFDDEDRMLGFVWGLSGQRDGAPTHWSHMLAVHEHARGLGVGKGLKFFQKDRLLAIGIRRMLWTYDPLVARNATLNLVRLGARPVEYVIDMYGPTTGSELHSGLGTDRFVVEWDLTTASGSSGATDERAPAGRSSCSVDVDDALARDRVIDRRFGRDLEQLARSPRGSEDPLWIEVPADIEALKRSDRQSALAYRDALRTTLPVLLDRGWVVDGAVWIDADRLWYRVRGPRSPA